jgi:phosphoenolpyruvate carboxylase
VGGYKATEQGEALDHKYARPELARRTLELVLGGVLLHVMDAQPRPSPEDEAVFREAFNTLAETGRREYRALVWEDPRFVEFFTTSTPLEEISALPIGSRPSKRKAGGLESLRAIPWVFAWTQNRAIVPGWYGVGSALEAYAAKPEGLVLLKRMYREWPFFRAVIDNVTMVLAKSDIAIASRYAKLAPESTRPLWRTIRAEHARTRRWVKRLTGEARLLDHNPQLQRSIALRNPYVDPMSFLQVELLRRKREGQEVSRPLLLTLNGIAAGMRNTG